MTNGRFNRSPSGTPASSSGDGGGDGWTLRVERRLASIETEIGHLARKQDISDLRTLIAEKETRTLRWLMGILATSVVALLAALVRTLIV